MGASGLILARTSDRSWIAALITAAAAALAFATRLNPLWMLAGRRRLGFRWRYLTKIDRQDRGLHQAPAKQNGREALLGREIDE